MLSMRQSEMIRAKPSPWVSQQQNLQIPLNDSPPQESTLWQQQPIKMIQPLSHFETGGDQINMKRKVMLKNRFENLVKPRMVKPIIANQIVKAAISKKTVETLITEKMPLPSESLIVTPQETLRTEPPRASEPRQQKLKIVQEKEQEMSQDSHLDGQEFKVHKLFATLENK